MNKKLDIERGKRLLLEYGSSYPDLYSSLEGRANDPNNVMGWSVSQLDKFERDNKYSKLPLDQATDELIDKIKLDYLLGISTLLNDFATNISSLIDIRDNSVGSEKVVASKELLGLLFPSAKDPRKLSIPDLDIEEILSKMENS